MANRPVWYQYRLYGSPHRGLANIGWTISPAMAELAPAMMKFFYDSAANTPQGQDQFICAASGLGYFYPDAFNGLDSIADITSRIMQKSDLHILNIIGNVFSDTFFTPYLNEPNIDAIFYYDYTNYSQLNGQAMCINNKPVISAQYDLWSYPYVPAIIGPAVNNQAKDPYSADGYSIIDVNVWSNTVDSILRCISYFDSTIRVVSPQDFVTLFKAGVTGCDSVTGIHQPLISKAVLNCYPNPVGSQANVSLTLPEETDGEIALYDLCGQKVETISSGLQTVGLHQMGYERISCCNRVFTCSALNQVLFRCQKNVSS